MISDICNIYYHNIFMQMQLRRRYSDGIKTSFHWHEKLNIFTCENSQTILAENFLGDLQILVASLV